MQSPQKIRQIAGKIAGQSDHHVALQSDYERITQEMYAKNLELAQINRVLSILRAIDIIILQSQGSIRELSAELSGAILESAPYGMMAILSQNRHAEKFVSFQGWALSQDRQQLPLVLQLEEKLQSLTLPFNGRWMDGPSRNLIIDLENMQTSTEVAPLEPEMSELLGQLHEHLQINSLYMTKLRARGMVVGVMVVGLHEKAAKIDDIELIERLGEPVGIALDNKLLFDENQRVLKRLQKANEKMKQLDEAKDEFISMASHQLRTPLTSVKGYLSMVLEGDAGDINDNQKKLLDQAFVSSQRMVFLIADLLNVSRLKTGKFVIEPAPTNLSEVIQGEVDQLKETAAARGLELTFEPPSNFPTLMLDETKIRQVIMNFTDNAIYYTPSGGHIRVTLTETDKAIEFAVTDDGMGVPKAEQPHLFNKFYRAGNAKKARPDGTGLGLFMAKKVIVAQGGSILFKSKEGQGSTFGFTFAKEALQVPATDQAKA